jgi:hypothetical protein
MLVAGLVLTIISGWFLFVRLHFLSAPGLARFFPELYLAVGAHFVGGVGVSIVSTLRSLRRRLRAAHPLR